MFRTVKSILFPDEFAKILAQANAFPRNTERLFKFRDYLISVTDFLSVAWQLKEIFEDEALYFKTDNNKPIIIDCGANVGIAVAYFKSIYANSNIICFEPDAKVFNQLKQNIIHNNWQNVTSHQAAVYIADTEMMFAANGADGGALHTDGTVKVKAIDLNHFLNDYNHIDFLKMDIEGAETEVINHIQDQLHKVKQLFIEYHSLTAKPQMLHQLLAILQKHGYRYYLKSINHIPWKKLANGYKNSMDIQLNIHAIRES